MTSFALLGAAATATGIFCLYAAWKRLLPQRRILVPLGWLLLFASPYLWLQMHGAEFGISYAILAAGFAAWIAVAANLQVRERRDTDRAEGKAVPYARSLWRHAGIFFMAVPLAGVASAFFSIAVSRAFPWTLVDEMVLAVFLFPVAWGAAAYWACADTRLLRPVAGLIVLGALSAAIVYV